jgi:6,7-dimethyl-8-ribityllumazine synthase
VIAVWSLSVRATKTRAQGGTTSAAVSPASAFYHLDTTTTHVAIVRARWNDQVTQRLLHGAVGVARAAGVAVTQFEVAGAFELPAAAEMLAATGSYDAVVPLGCLIRGETAHFDVLAHAVARGLMDVGLRHTLAVPFGVLTCDTLEQALARAGGDTGDSGAEAMAAALELVAMKQRLLPV